MLRPSSRLAAIVAAAGALLFFAVCSAAATGEDAAEGAGVVAKPVAHNEAAPGDVCKNGNTTYYWTLEGRFAGNESYRVLCEPTSCMQCSGGWKPVSVTMYLYWEEDNTCGLTVQAEIREAPGPDGQDQGRLLAASDPTVMGPFRPAGLWAVTVAMPRDSAPVSGRCYATLRFLDTCNELPAIVAAPGACEPGKSWVNRDGAWRDLKELDLPGNLCAFATFECQPVSDVESMEWGTIKGKFKN